MTFKEFVHKMLHDAHFRHEVRIDPEKALREAGTRPTREQVEALKNIDFSSIEAVAESFGDSLIT